MTVIRATGGGVAESIGLPVNANVIFYVDASNPSSFAGSGTDVVDLKANGSNGTIDGTASFSNGAFQFSSTSDAVSFSKNTTLTNLYATGATVMAFIQANTQGTSGFGRIASTENAGNTQGWALFVENQDSTGMEFGFIRRTDTTNGFWNALSGRPIPRGSTEGTFGGGVAFVSVAAAYDESTPAVAPDMFVNGFSMGTSGTLPTGNFESDASNDLIIGNRGGGSEPWDGQIAIVLIFDKKLDEAEVTQIHNLFAPRLQQKGPAGIVQQIARGSGSLSGPANLMRAGGEGFPETNAGSMGNINFGFTTGSGHGIADAGTNGAAILSGQNNLISGGSDFSIVVGGTDNDITVSSGNCFIGGGSGNTMNAASNSVVVGGASNTIVTVSGTVSNVFIGGGFLNNVRKGTDAVIVGGRSNQIGTDASISVADSAFIGAGEGNHIRLGDHAVITGGEGNDIGQTADCSWATIPGGRLNEVDGALYGVAWGNRSHVTHNGAWLWSDGVDQDENSDRVDQFKVVADGGFTLRTTQGFGGSAGDPGEAVENFTGHATTTDATANDTVIGTLDTDQQTMMFDVQVHSIQDAGANARFEKFMVTAYRTGGSVTVSSTQIAVTDVGSTGVTYTFQPNGNDIEIRVTGVASENWQHSWWLTRQKGGLTS